MDRPRVLKQQKSTPMIQTVIDYQLIIHWIIWSCRMIRVILKHKLTTMDKNYRLNMHSRAIGTDGYMGNNYNSVVIIY